MNDFADKKTSGGCLNLQEVTNQLMTFLRSHLLSSPVPSCRPLGRGKNYKGSRRTTLHQKLRYRGGCREFTL